MKDWRHIPERPRLPPVFTSSIVFWVTDAYIYSLCKGLDAHICSNASIVCFCASLLFACIFFMVAKTPVFEKRSERFAAMSSLQTLFSSHKFALTLLISIAAGSSLAFGYSAHVMVIGDKLLSDAPKQINVTLLEDCSEGTFLPRALCRMQVDGGG